MSKTTKELLVEYNSLAEAQDKPTLKQWKESKTKLQAKIDDLYQSTAEAITKPKVKPLPEGHKSCAQWCRDLGKNPKVARAKLRKHGLADNLKSIPVGSDAYNLIAAIASK